MSACLRACVVSSGEGEGEGGEGCLPMLTRPDEMGGFGIRSIHPRACTSLSYRSSELIPAQPSPAQPTAPSSAQRGFINPTVLYVGLGVWLGGCGVFTRGDGGGDKPFRPSLVCILTTYYVLHTQYSTHSTLLYSTSHSTQHTAHSNLNLNLNPHLPNGFPSPPLPSPPTRAQPSPAQHSPA